MQKSYLFVTFLVSLFIFNNIAAQERDGGIPISDNFTSGGNAAPTSVAKNWYEKFAIRGYAQLRYNRLLETNPDLGCEQCDKSWGEGGGFFMRRVRVIFFGQISPRVYF